jgi:small GTP-binding protein
MGASPVDWQPSSGHAYAVSAQAHLLKSSESLMSETPVVQKKICMLGAFAVGKTSLVRRFVEGRFDDRYLSSIGVKISRKPVVVAQATVNLIVWDLAGSEDYNGLQASYLQGAVGGIVICDLIRADTLRSWEYYTHRLRQVNPGARVVLVANKSDLVEACALSDGDLRRANVLCDDGTGIPPCFVSSAKTGENVEAVFRRLAELLVSS